MEIKSDITEKNYNFKPVTSEEEIAQNINNIIQRAKYNVPLAREKGIIVENIDKPQIILKAELIAIISEEIDREEPCFLLSEVLIDDSSNIENGQILANIIGGINE